MSFPQELQELQDKRAKLEDESLTLREEQKRLEEKAKALEQKIIQELSNKNDDARQKVSNLSSKVNDLEQRLKRIAGETIESTNEPTQSQRKLNQQKQSPHK